MKNIVCVIQARGGSKGIPKKNIYPIDGHPLISYTICAAKKSKYIKDIYISTDSNEIAKISQDYGGVIPFLRANKLASDRVASYTSLVDFVKKLEHKKKIKYDYIIELPCVTPFRTFDFIDKAIEIILKKKEYDSVISYVNTGEKHPTRLKKIIKNKVQSFCKEYQEAELKSFRQSFEDAFIRNGAIYLMTRNCLFNLKSRIGNKSYPLIMPPEKSINIDEKFDLVVAKTLIENGYCDNKPEKKIIFKTDTFKKNNKKKLLISAPFEFLEEEKKKLIKNYECIFAYGQPKTFVKKIIPKVDGWICSPSSQYKIDGEIIKKAKNLKLIVTPSTGSNHIDTNLCKKKNIKIFTLRESKKFNKIKASSEFTFALMLSVVRKIDKAQKIVKSGYWRNVESLLRTSELENKNLGIIGFGRIGSNLAKYANSFGMNVFSYDKYKIIKKKNVKQEHNIKKLLENSDIVCCCINYIKSNENFFSKNLFKHMKKGSYFINTSRGETVVEKDLIHFLKKKKIKAAGVDVVWDEHNIHKKNNLLIEHSKKNDNLTVTPHIAGLTYESETKAAKIATNFIYKNL